MRHPTANGVFNFHIVLCQPKKSVAHVKMDSQTEPVTLPRHYLSIGSGEASAGKPYCHTSNTHHHVMHRWYNYIKLGREAQGKHGEVIRV